MKHSSFLELSPLIAEFDDRPLTRSQSTSSVSRRNRNEPDVRPRNNVVDGYSTDSDVSYFRCQFYNVLRSFYARGAQTRKKDSQVISLFTLLGSTSVKAERKYVGKIEPRCKFY